MRPRRFSRLTTLLGVALLVVAGAGGCGRPDPRPERRIVDGLAAPAPQPSRRTTYLVIRVEARRLDLMEEDAGAPIASFPIAVGRPGHETPTGRFRVEEMVEHPDFHRFDPKDPTRVLERVPPGPRNPLGERWIGFAHGEGWTVGIHGTPHPELLGRAVSGGCVRMRNADVIRVYDEVALGTLVIVHP
ncbi:MAG: L,D-transpeptidase family protein [Deltaproteobacteria bacterium]|nr:L,D-transpeptidase family protein [Deltaproteobacteria bacterium]